VRILRSVRRHLLGIFGIANLIVPIVRNAPYVGNQHFGTYSLSLPITVCIPRARPAKHAEFPLPDAGMPLACYAQSAEFHSRPGIAPANLRAETGKDPRSRPLPGRAPGTAKRLFPGPMVEVVEGLL